MTRSSPLLAPLCALLALGTVTCTPEVSDGDPEPENTAARCEDGRDNDQDGYADCRDPDCAQFCETCSPTGDESTEAACSDGQDNDCNGYVDCEDWACSDFCCVAGLEDTVDACSNGVDNDCPPDGFEPNGTVCNDADVCTADDECQDGVCAGNPDICGDGTVLGACGEECDDCTATDEVCNALGTRCVECVDTADCPTGMRCVADACVPCDDPEHCGDGCIDCTAIEATPICDGSRCVCTEQSCPEGDECVDGVCTTIAPVDASLPDL